MSMTEASSQYFRDTATSWDTLRKGYFSEAVRETAVRKAYLRSEMVVADVGAGTGFLSAALAPLVRRVYAVDGSAEMLDIARKNLGEFDNVEFHTADGLDLPFPDESLDAVFANMYLHHCPDPLAAIREMVRVLRPGGRLVITDLDSHPHAWMKEEMADVWQGFERDDLRAWYREAGLVNVLVDCTGESCCAASQKSQSEPALADISVFVATGTRRMAMRDSVQSAYSARVESGCGCGSSTSGDSCCGTEGEPGGSCCSGAGSLQLAPGYTIEDVSAAPQEAAEISLGCGNPIAMARLKPGETVLDIGSGGGLDSFIAAGRVGPGGRVIGVDMTPAMLERARESARRAGITNVEFRQGYAEALPVEDSTIDVILSNCVINLTEDKGQVFREALRALRPGGRLEVSDVVAGGAVPIEARENAGDWAECITGALPEQEYLDLIAQAGFLNVSARRSASSGSVYGVPVYSITVSARKPRRFMKQASCCG